MITNRESGTNVHEIADGIYRINTPIAIPGAGAFSFNQYLIVDDAPMLFHTGLRHLFPHVREAVDSIIPAESLRYIGLSHVEADECGALNDWLTVAPRAEAVCGRVAAMVSINDMADRPPRALADGEDLALGRHTCELVRHTAYAAWLGVRAYDGTSHQDIPVRRSVYTGRHRQRHALTESDILEPSEAFRAPMDYYAHAPNTGAILERLAREQPTTLAFMHGSAWRGDGAGLLRALAERLS